MDRPAAAAPLDIVRVHGCCHVVACRAMERSTFVPGVSVVVVEAIILERSVD